MPANFRTYEGQSRLLTAVIAAHPTLKLNYKEISIHYGSDWTESGIEHFFRPVKKNAKAIQDMVKRKEDPANFNHNVFQFRQIKKDAESLRQGKEVTPASASSTPAKTPKTPKTPGGIGRGKRTASATTGKLTPASKKVKRESDDETWASLTAADQDMILAARNVGEQTPSKSRTQYNEPPPALDLTQVTSPEDNAETLTPHHEDPAFSFAQANSQPPALSSDPWADYSGSFAAGGGQSYFTSLTKDDYEEDDGEV